MDLDVEVQGTISEIYGLSLDVGGFFKGDMERASFQSVWYKLIEGPKNHHSKGTRVQCVLQNVQFSAKHRDSKIVKHLKENLGPNRQLSICFNIDLMGERPAFNFSFARIVGSIGLAGEKAITRNMGQDGDRHAHFDPIWRPNITINYMGVDQNIKF